ncbi:MAG: permease [Bacteroidetes bacterium]|nr:MAG: permease [Bacteroidota bacterium]
MKTLYKFLIKSYIGPLIGTFFIALFVLIMHFLWMYVDDLVGKGLEWYIIVELIFYASATFVPMALPLSILLSSLMMFGNLGERYELVAMKASGISLNKVMRPLIVLSVMISLLAFVFSNNVLPVANLKFRSMLYDVKKQKLSFNIPEKVYYNGIDGYVIRVEEKEKDGNVLRGIMIYNHTKSSGNTNVIIADSGVMTLSQNEQNLYFRLYQGYSFDESKDKNNFSKDPLQRNYFDQQVIRFTLSGFDLKRTDENLFKNNYHMLNVRQLEHSRDSIYQKMLEIKSSFSSRLFTESLSNYAKYDSVEYQKRLAQSDDVDSLDYGDILQIFSTPKEKKTIVKAALDIARRGKQKIEYCPDRRMKKLIVKHDVAWHRKFTLSFACIVLFFIGAPLGAIIRKGGLGMPLVVSVLMFILYRIISLSAEKSAIAGNLSPFVGMWLASFVFLPFGIFLMVKATTDSPILDIDIWKRKINKIISTLKLHK